jgi:hypothetical protein
MSFRGVFIAIVLGTAMVVSAFMLQSRRPRVEVTQPTAALVRATGKCAECHRQETSAIVHEYEMSRHNALGVTCLDCHQPAEGQDKQEHRGFAISPKVTAANCRQCHRTQYEQYLRSRHAGPSWAAVGGKKDFTAEQVAFFEQYHRGGVDRPPHGLVAQEGPAAIRDGCMQCHAIGKPNKDGSFGTCTACHARHAASVELARLPETCGQCHMGPDHSQMEIYHESKHGVVFNAQRPLMNLKADPKHLTTADMPVPTCSTCHMSGLEGQKFTHDVTERLSYCLFADVSGKRPGFELAQANMKETCQKCHSTSQVQSYYKGAEAVLGSMNEFVSKASDVIKKLRADGLLTPDPFDEPIELLYFDLWHYGGRTAKHGAFMGGADFVQWHGFYDVYNKSRELARMADELRKEKGHAGTKAAAR